MRFHSSAGGGGGGALPLSRRLRRGSDRVDTNGEATGKELPVPEMLAAAARAARRRARDSRASLRFAAHIHLLYIRLNMARRSS